MTVSNLATLRILVVENHLRMRTLITQMLVAGGVTKLDEASNGAEALQFLHDPSSELPDVVISDIHMERLDGLELCNAIRRDKSAEIRAIPILSCRSTDTASARNIPPALGASFWRNL